MECLLQEVLAEDGITDLEWGGGFVNKVILMINLS